MVIAIWHPLVTAHVVVFALFLVASSATYTPDYAVYHNLSRIYAHVAELAESFPAYLRVDHSFKSRNGLSQLLMRLSNFSGSSYAGPHLQSFKVLTPSRMSWATANLSTVEVSRTPHAYSFLSLGT